MRGSDRSAQLGMPCFRCCRGSSLQALPPLRLQIIFASNSFAPGAFGVGLLFRILPSWLELAVFNLFFRAVVRLPAAVH